ncbi:MAG: DNA adenine methylase [Candidatus Thermoplasmatota archaeon]|nr:DNA adenine methylase [Euryarchaeota archaeon]MBU4031466.1 DNA adenine methylase [Candidatus Thermoplasmatota archaeon]MBU4070774.1 DNA adenine methylase [Candidatus Thermoplasmatota archaeon]MBU4144677.1 DNA adenine methylase [Candidatus Thermoplasmatota archaeon]MBU4592762.1 DNA adenine methylase [Candidatus Thermoplasmatota archaeon]
MPIVNVASVKKLSPFRYPGGKTWLVPTVRKWLKTLNPKPELFIEPFLGGGIISLTVANENLAKHIIMSELDDEVASVWSVLLYGNVDQLVQSILSFNMTVENVKERFSLSPTTPEEKAFQTILKNRVYHGGIMANGSGLIKNGENGKGIKSRWYPKTIIKRMRKISSLSFKLEFIEGDGFNLIDRYLDNENSVFFVDPPYTASTKNAGRRLYRHYQIEHEKLFQLFSNRAYPFMMTYDDSIEIRNLCDKYSMNYQFIPMKNTHNLKQQELIISNDLRWFP